MFLSFLRFYKNCPRRKLPSRPNSNANPKLNPDHDRGQFFSGAIFRTAIFTTYKVEIFQKLTDKLIQAFSKHLAHTENKTIFVSLILMRPQNILSHQQ